MNIVTLQNLIDSTYSEQVWELICETDKEFVPPLSYRESTTQNNLEEVSENELPVQYFEQVKSQSIILALDENRVIGFISFRKGCKEIKECDIYVSTVIVSPQARGKRTAEKMYAELFKNNKGITVTRTWNKNHTHIHILDKLGFKLIKEIKNHRGKGIDTVYFSKEVK